MKTVHGIYLPSGDTHFDTMIAPNGTYQLKKFNKAMEFVRNRDIALDIGAHVGLWTRVMSPKFSEVYCFEPMTEHRECWEKNTRGLVNVTMFPLALSDKPEQLPMTMPVNNTGHTHVARHDEPVTETVEAVTLDSIKLPGSGKIDFVKIDVEGFETAVVKGGEQTLRRHRPVIIIEQKPNGNAEAQGYRQKDALRLLLQWGFKQVAEISGDHILVGG